MLPEDSPQSAQSAPPNSAVPTITPFTPFTPLSALSAFSGASTNLLPLKFMTTTTTPATPVDGRSSPASPYTAPATAPTTTLSSSKHRPSPNYHSRGLSESSTTVLASRPSHRRTESEASIMDRGRPKKPSDGTSTKNTTTNASQQKSFETLPQGVKACDVTSKFSPQDIESLRRQALDQAAQFEVLAAKDVSDLSRELRALDERCEYLRRTHRSLRAGCRNLHDRICSYHVVNTSVAPTALSAPAAATFTIASAEEALAELESSIDDWVFKLEQAENRRTRVRQKLLEHVAAATSISTGGADMDMNGAQDHEPMNLCCSKITTDHTPTRSPTRAPSSPHGSRELGASPMPTSPVRLAHPVPAKLSTPLLPPSAAENASISERHRDSYSTVGRPSAESIRIYADSDVYALLADVEEINRMGQGCMEEEVLLTQMKYEGMSRSDRGRGVTNADEV
ncbi:hypothetical protein V502_00988 [Pseudogymnoascus sp. VKM F-4520 (FW-2644)]|nr:hypothetical protein V502_00988 [Pseudogymnoascus sp. VKM F-4520 (FW-2644)]